MRDEHAARAQLYDTLRTVALDLADWLGTVPFDDFHRAFGWVAPVTEVETVEILTPLVTTGELLPLGNHEFRGRRSGS